MARYDSIASEYERRIVPRFQPIADALVRFASVPPGAFVVEIGAGTGGLTRRLPADAFVVASDIALSSLELARDAVPPAMMAGADQTALPFRSGVADVVAAQFTMVLDSPAALREARRVLRPGGRLVVAAWRDDYTEFALLSAARVAVGLEPIPPYDEEAHAARLRDAGFGDLRFEAVRFTNTWSDADDYLAYRAAFGVMPLEPNVWADYCAAIERSVRAMPEVTFTWSVVLASGVAV